MQNKQADTEMKNGIGKVAGHFETQHSEIDAFLKKEED